MKEHKYSKTTLIEDLNKFGYEIAPVLIDTGKTYLKVKGLRYGLGRGFILEVE